MQRAALTAVVLNWAALGVLTLLRQRPPRAREVKRGRRWLAGMMVQGLAIFLVWALPRPPLTPLAPGFAGTALAALAIPLAIVSVWIMIACQRTLGRQFAYEARLVEAHKLITTGPYAFVRHPIYTALYGLVFATALAFSQWYVLPLFTVVYALGTALRVRSEETLLRGAFGAEFDQYARSVPSVIPRVR